MNHDRFDTLRVLQVSDTHLSARAPEAARNWDRVVDHVQADPPDLVVNTGDVSLDGAASVADLEFAHSAHERLGTAWRVIPGNHDVGDFDSEGQPIDAERRRRYASVFGESFWTVDLAGWRLVGADIQTLQSGQPDAPGWWDWLESAMVGSARIALFIHRPLMPFDVDEYDESRRYVVEPHRARLQDLIVRSGAQLVASGHVHQARSVEVDGCHHEWAPSTWAMLPDSFQPTIGRKMCGVVLHHLAADKVTSEVVVPPGLSQQTVGVDFEPPY